jgi:hypothetical protein
LTLAEQIELIEGIDHPFPERLAKVADTLRFLQKWEPEIRANLPTWKAVRADPTIKALATEIPISSIRVTDASE